MNKHSLRLLKNSIPVASRGAIDESAIAPAQLEPVVQLGPNRQGFALAQDGLSRWADKASNPT